jgi:carotenoid cleavage dioxygenase-like enzyme
MTTQLLQTLNQAREKFTSTDAEPLPLVISTRADLDVTLETVYGEIPEDLYGHVFVNTSSGTVNDALPYPKEHSDGSYNQEYGSPLLGSGGYLFRFDMNEKGKVKFKGRLIKSPTYYADEALKYGSIPKLEHLAKGFKSLGISRLSFLYGFGEQLATAVMPVKFAHDGVERILVTADLGRPYEIDPQTLKVITPIGKLNEYEPTMAKNFWIFPAIEGTAHPSYDPVTQEFFNVNYSKALASDMQFGGVLEFLQKDADAAEKWFEKMITRAEKLQTVNKILRFFYGVIHQLQSFFQRKVEGTKHLKNWFETMLQKDTQPTKEGLLPENEVFVMKFNGEGQIKKWRMVDGEGKNVKISQCIHQTAITEEYFLLIDAAFKTTPDVILFNNPFPHNPRIDTWVRKMTTRPQEPFTNLYIIQRSDLKDGVENVVAKMVTIKPEFVHFSANYIHPKNELTIFTAHNSAACLAEWIRPYDKLKATGETIEAGTQGEMSLGEMDIGSFGKIVIDIQNDKATINEAQTKIESSMGEPIYAHEGGDKGKHTWGVGIYTYRDMISAQKPVNEIKNMYFQFFGLEARRLTEFIYDLYEQYPNRKVSAEEMLKNTIEGVPAQLARLNTETMDIEDYFLFKKGYNLRSLQFIPCQESTPDLDPSLDGYILCVMINEEQIHGKTTFLREFWIFDAADLEKGPVCVLSHPKILYAFTLHSVWVESLTSQPPAYQVNIKEDYTEKLETLSLLQNKKALEAFLEKNVFPHFHS